MGSWDICSEIKVYLEHELLHRNTAGFQQHSVKMKISPIATSNTERLMRKLWYFNLFACRLTKVHLFIAPHTGDLSTASLLNPPPPLPSPPAFYSPSQTTAELAFQAISQDFFRRWLTTLCWDSGSRSSNHQGPEWRPGLSFYLWRHRRSWKGCVAAATPGVCTAFSPSSGFFTNVTPCSSNNLQARWTSGTAIPMCPVKCRCKTKNLYTTLIQQALSISVAVWTEMKLQNFKSCVNNHRKLI